MTHKAVIARRGTRRGDPGKKKYCPLLWIASLRSQ